METEPGVAPLAMTPYRCKECDIFERCQAVPVCFSCGKAMVEIDYRDWPQLTANMSWHAEDVLL